MKEVLVSKAKLLAKLRSNRAEHREIFLDALAGWQDQVTRALEKAVEEAKIGKKFCTEINLPRPEDHTSDYDVAIEEVIWSVSNSVTLTLFEFRNFVLDDWGWKPDFIKSSASYSSSSSRSSRSENEAENEAS